MLYDGILDIIAFTDEMKNKYNKYKALTDDRIDALAFSYINEDMPVEEVNKVICSLETEHLHRHTIKLIFLLECTGYVYEQYKKQGISDEIYFDTMKDIKCKIKECEDVNGIFGYDSESWFGGFFKLTRFGFGRLQFDITTHQGESVEVAGRIVKEGDFMAKCHIPSSGPLLHEDCIKAYKAVYEFVKPNLNDEFLIIECHSWMLFPYYKDFFGENSNVRRFINDYELFGHFETDQFYDAWRFFGKDAKSDNLPSKTSLQRCFVDYMKTGKPYGYGKGIFLFDGKNILK